MRIFFWAGILTTVAISCGCSEPTAPDQTKIGATVSKEQAISLAMHGDMVAPNDFVKVLESTPPPLRRQVFQANMGMMHRLSDSDRTKAQQLMAESKGPGIR